MVWLLNVKLTAEQSTYRAMAYWKLKTGPQLILRLLRTIRCLEPDKDGHIMVHLQFSKLFKTLIFLPLRYVSVQLF